MIKGIHHVAIHVHDLDRMVKFYSEAFGFEAAIDVASWSDSVDVDRIIDVQRSAARTTIMRAGTCYLELFEFTSPEPTSKRALRPFDKGYTHFCVDVTDIEHEVERLKTLGMTFGDRTPVDSIILKALYGRDPEGNVIEILETRAECPFRLEQLPPRSG
jgi:catechol 2,3-dioxygenase-like lactoylglutathione lyase family enzyme